MSEPDRAGQACAVCGKSFPPANLVAGDLIHEGMTGEIRRKCADWSADRFICREDLRALRSEFVLTMLASEKGELTSLEHQVVESLRRQALVSSDIDAESDVGRTFGERLTDKIATFGGSWKFLICFAGFLVLWVVLNCVVLATRPPDPYPFIFLNLVLSCLAAIQAPVIMMSQNRQEGKDRVRSRHDYQVNLKAELEIRHLHEKMDHLLTHQWERLVQIQQIQIELLSEISGKK